MSGLVLKLGPKERVLINGAVIENGDRRTRITIVSPNANILRLRDALHPDDVTTPVRRVCYIAQLVLKFYYPGVLEKKLKKLRYTPRINPENGKKMKLLSEDEEDAYLDEGMQAEENVFSVDYDVWIDESTGYTKIEKYKGHLSALECDRCGFQTLRLEKEEIIRPATETEDGELLKEYKCSYCNRIKRKNVVLAHKIKDASSGRLIDDPLTHDARISVVKIEIHGRKGEVREFDFQNIDQAKNFLNEFDFEKLEEESI